MLPIFTVSDRPSSTYDAIRSAVIAQRYDDLDPLLKTVGRNDAPYVLLLVADDSNLQKQPYLNQVLDRVPPEVLNHMVGPSILNTEATPVPLWYQVYRRVPYGHPNLPPLKDVLDTFVAHGADLRPLVDHPDLTMALGPRARAIRERIEQFQRETDFTPPAMTPVEQTTSTSGLPGGPANDEAKWRNPTRVR